MSSGVLPPTSRHLLPSCLQSLMTNSDSPLLHFYPETFELDQNEKKHDWESIVLLPFIDEELLLKTIEKFYPNLEKNEIDRNRHSASLCFQATSTLRPTELFLQKNPFFPPIKETRASCSEIPLNSFHCSSEQLKFGRFPAKDIVIFPKFPVLNVFSYQFDFKDGAVNLFETRSRAKTLVLNLTSRPDSDCILYNNEWKRNQTNICPPFQLNNVNRLVARYLGKQVFVNWPHFRSAIVCAVSDFHHLYLWTNHSAELIFDLSMFNQEDAPEFRSYTQTPIYVTARPLEIDIEANRAAKWTVIKLNEIQTHREYQKATQINRLYELRRGVAIGPIPILLYVCPLIGYRTKYISSIDQCRTLTCFSEQARAFPIQTTLFNLPNYRSDLGETPSSLNEFFKRDEPVFILKNPCYSSLAHVQQIERNNHGKSSVSCQIDSSHLTIQPDLHQMSNEIFRHQLRYFTAQEAADRLKLPPMVVAKITGKISVFYSKKKNKRSMPINIGLSWKANKPLKQLYGYTKKLGEIWSYSEAALKVIDDYRKKFPEVFEELTQKPNDDKYYESNIWPDNNGKAKVQELRLWMKTLPSYSMSLTDGQWELLDIPVIDEIDRCVKAVSAKQTKKKSANKVKTMSFDPQYLFKPSESLGICNPDVDTVFYILDRVVVVRLGTGVPLGTRGTIVGIMWNQTPADIFYEVLFDNLSETTLETILFGKNGQPCRIKVRSYHLLNYSHSLRLRSTEIIYRQQRSFSGTSNLQQPIRSNNKAQPHPPDRRNSNPAQSIKQPKSAPAAVVTQNPMQMRPREEPIEPSTVTLGAGDQPPLSSNSKIPNSESDFLKRAIRDFPHSVLQETLSNSSVGVPLPMVPSSFEPLPFPNTNSMLAPKCSFPDETQRIFAPVATPPSPATPNPTTPPQGNASSSSTAPKTPSKLNVDALQFVPSQVFRNMAKGSK